MFLFFIVWIFKGAFYQNCVLGSEFQIIAHCTKFYCDSYHSLCLTIKLHLAWSFFKNISSFLSVSSSLIAKEALTKIEMMFHCFFRLLDIIHWVGSCWACGLTSYGQCYNYFRIEAGVWIQRLVLWIIFSPLFHVKGTD